MNDPATTTWDDLASALANGEDPAVIFAEYDLRITMEQDTERFTPIPRHVARLVTAFEGQIIDDKPVADWATLQSMGALTPDGDSLTSEATRKIFDGWDASDRQSS